MTLKRRTALLWLRLKRTSVQLDKSLFVLGLALALGATIGIEAGPIDVGAVRSGWARVPVALLGVAIIAFSFLVRESGPAPEFAPEDGQRSPLPALVPGTSFIGDMPGLPTRFVGRGDLFEAVQASVASCETVALVGMAGAGKTILAAAVARDPLVQNAFSQ